MSYLSWATSGAQEFMGEYEIIAPDLRGYGGSDKPKESRWHRGWVGGCGWGGGGWWWWGGGRDRGSRGRGSCDSTAPLEVAGRVWDGLPLETGVATCR